MKGQVLYEIVGMTAVMTERKKDKHTDRQTQLTNILAEILILASNKWKNAKYWPKS